MVSDAFVVRTLPNMVRELLAVTRNLSFRPFSLSERTQGTSHVETNVRMYTLNLAV